MSPTNRYSADVVLSLLVGDQTIRLAQVGPDFVVLADPVVLPPCRAEVLVNVDGHSHRRAVFLVEGAMPSKVRTLVETSRFD